MKLYLQLAVTEVAEPFLPRPVVVQFRELVGVLFHFFLFVVIFFVVVVAAFILLVVKPAGIQRRRHVH